MALLGGVPIASGNYMKSVASKSISSGLACLDEMLQGLWPGDNVVWQVDRLEDYSYLSEAFARQVIRDNLYCIYFRFAPHPPVLKPLAGITTVQVDPGPGFDYFSSRVHEIINEKGRGVCYVFDNLSALVNNWATDESLANFYQVVCPFMYELEDVAYFSLTRGQHSRNTVARIRDTTQILVDVYHVKDNTYVHPLKVWGRYSPRMFVPHLVTGTNWSPVSQSGDAAAVLSGAGGRLTPILSSSIAPWDHVYRRLVQYKEAAPNLPIILSETSSLKRELSRMMIGNHERLNEMADRYLTLEDLLSIRARLIGSGQIGGKAAGMLLARRVLAEAREGLDLSEVLEEHDSFYIGSDVFFTFLVSNNLFRLRLQAMKHPEFSRDEFHRVEQSFLDGQFSQEIVEQFRDMLDYYGQAPIIVRSSSLLEDSFTHSFAGKYRSEFCANQSSPEERLEDFLRAIKLVYASALNPDALSYRRKQGIGESDEQMAILVQRVSGMPYKEYFFPSLAGVAFSGNLYAWTSRVDPQKGMIRLVFGLGTRAVNRTGGDYARMIAISHPELRPEIGTQVVKYSQRNVDLLDLEANQFTAIPLGELIAGGDYPHLNLLVSSLEDGYLDDAPYLKGAERHFVLTFNNLVKRTALVSTIGEMLIKLEEAWGQPIDIEFTAHIRPDGRVRINLLQCRALRLPRALAAGTRVPDNLPREQILFRSHRAINAGAVGNIRHIIYISPKKYRDAASVDVKKSLGRIVGKLNETLRGKESRALLMGPGRWGSNNIELGVNVSYADIDNAAVLVEMAHERAGYTPEVSYGTHFFQDLVEADIVYLPVYPEDSASDFNTTFFEGSPNIFAELLPDWRSFSEVVHVIDVPAAAHGAHAHVVADPETRSAICFLQ